MEIHAIRMTESHLIRILRHDSQLAIWNVWLCQKHPDKNVYFLLSTMWIVDSVNIIRNAMKKKIGIWHFKHVHPIHTFDMYTTNYRCNLIVTYAMRPLIELFCFFHHAPKTKQKHQKERKRLKFTNEFSSQLSLTLLPNALHVLEQSDFLAATTSINML